MNQSGLRVVFAGTPAFAEIALQALLSSKHQVIAVYTQPDKPAGRGQKLTESPVKQLAKTAQLPIYQPSTLKTPEAQATLAALQPDVLVVAAYGLILPDAILKIPTKGCINIHPSLLPRWRGAAPIQRTLFSGDTTTGVTIMQMDAGLDTGPILYQTQYTLREDETTASLHDYLANEGGKALIHVLDRECDNPLPRQIQNDAQATYAAKITKEEARIHWQHSAKQLSSMIRAFNPWPVAFTTIKDEIVRVWMAKALDEKTTQLPGTIVNASRDGIDIATGEGVLRLLQLQWPGGKTLSVRDVMNARQHEFVLGEALS